MAEKLRYVKENFAIFNFATSFKFDLYYLGENIFVK